MKNASAFLKIDRLIARTRESHQGEIDEQNRRNRRRRTELIAWLALLEVSPA